VIWRNGETILIPPGIASAVFSTLLAIPVARALARRSFPGRGLLITLMGAPFLLPAVVAVLGLLAVFGRAGLINSAVTALGLPPVSIFGLHGVVIAHVFLNLPLATRMILQGWLALPAERIRLAQSLGFTPRETFRHLEWPMLREVLPGVALVILVICLTSFAVVLTLGGGPSATTIELAIYQAVRFEFDLSRAAGLAGVLSDEPTVVIPFTALAEGRLILTDELIRDALAADKKAKAAEAANQNDEDGEDE